MGSMIAVGFFSVMYELKVEKIRTRLHARTGSGSSWGARSAGLPDVRNGPDIKLI